MRYSLITSPLIKILKMKAAMINKDIEFLQVRNSPVTVLSLSCKGGGGGGRKLIKLTCNSVYCKESRC